MHAYGLIIGISVVVYYHLTQSEWDRAGIHNKYFTPVFLGVLFFSLLGARLYHVADNWGYYRDFPWLILQIWNGGLGIIGALLFAFCFLLLITKFYRLSSWLLFNIFATHLLLALGIGRLANLFSPGGFWLESIPLLLAYIIFIIIRIFKQKLLKPPLNQQLNSSPNTPLNQPLIYFLISYGFIRILTDRFRTDLWYTTNNLPVSSIIAVLMVLCGLGLLINRRGRLKADGQI